MPSGTPMIPSGIWSSANARLKSVTAPSPSGVASAVTTMNVIWVAPSPMARGAIRISALRACGVAGVDPRRVAEAEPGQRPELDEQVPERAEDDADGETLDAERRAEDEGAADDREVVDDRRDGRRREPAAGVEDARRDRAHAPGRSGSAA